MSPAEARVLALLRARPGAWVDREEVVDRLGAHDARALPALVRAGLVDRDWPGYPGTRAAYRAKPAA